MSLIAGISLVDALFLASAGALLAHRGRHRLLPRHASDTALGQWYLS